MKVKVARVTFSDPNTVIEVSMDEPRTDYSNTDEAFNAGLKLLKPGTIPEKRHQATINLSANLPKVVKEAGLPGLVVVRVYPSTFDDSPDDSLLLITCTAGSTFSGDLNKAMQNFIKKFAESLITGDQILMTTVRVS